MCQSCQCSSHGVVYMGIHSTLLSFSQDLLSPNLRCFHSTLCHLLQSAAASFQLVKSFHIIADICCTVVDRSLARMSLGIWPSSIQCTWSILGCLSSVYMLMRLMPRLKSLQVGKITWWVTGVVQCLRWWQHHQWSVGLW